MVGLRHQSDSSDVGQLSVTVLISPRLPGRMIEGEERYSRHHTRWLNIWNEKSINDLTKTSIQRDMLHAGL